MGAEPCRACTGEWTPGLIPLNRNYLGEGFRYCRCPAGADLAIAAVEIHCADVRSIEARLVETRLENARLRACLGEISSVSHHHPMCKVNACSVYCACGLARAALQGTGS